MATKKPTISRKERSYHEAKASQRGRRSAAAQGADPAHIDALMDDGKGLTIAGITLKPLTLGTIWALQKVGSSYGTEDGQNKQLDIKAVALGALCFADPLRMFNMAKEDKHAELETEAFDLAMRMTTQITATINSFINGQIAITNGDTAGEMQAEAEAATAKKPQENSEAAKES